MRFIFWSRTMTVASASPVEAVPSDTAAATASSIVDDDLPLYPHPARAFFRSMLSAMMSLLHPFKTTVIDVTTGKVVDEY